MAWPFSRLRTYAPGSQVFSADLNAIQDEIIARRNRSILISPASFLYTPDTLPQIGIDEGGGFWRAFIGSTGTLGGTADITPFLMPGDVIKDLIVRWQNGATPASGGNFDIGIIRTPMSTLIPVQFAVTAEDTDTGGADALRSRTISVGHTVLSDNSYGVEFEMYGTAVGDQAGFCGITVVLGT